MFLFPVVSTFQGQPSKAKKKQDIITALHYHKKMCSSIRSWSPGFLRFPAEFCKKVCRFILRFLFWCPRLDNQRDGVFESNAL